MKNLTAVTLLTLALGTVGPPGAAFAAIAFQQNNNSSAGKITDTPVVQGTGETWAQVDWTTFTGGDSTVRYGTNPNRLDQTTQGSASSPQGQYQHHSVRIENLQPGTTYYYQASSGNGSTSAAAQAPATFTTKANSSSQTGNTTANSSLAGEIIDVPVVQGTGDTWAQVDWTTFTGGNSSVRFGTDPNNLDQTAQGVASNPQGQYQHHSVRIENLQPGTTYYFRASSGNGSTAASGQAQAAFTTKPHAGGQPENSSGQSLKIMDGPKVESIGSDGATVAWTTNTGGSSVVRYGTDRNNITQTAQSPYSDNEGASSQTHRVRIAHLQPNTTYYFTVDSGQGEDTGTEAKSAVGQFTTKGDQAGNGPAGAVKIIDGPKVESTGRDWATIAWTTNTGGSSVVRYGTDRNSLAQTTQSPYADNEGASYQTHRVRIAHLQPNTTYYFMVDSGQGEDTGTEAKSSVGQFTTKQ